jgi:hypothetical protein
MFAYKPDLEFLPSFTYEPSSVSMPLSSQLYVNDPIPISSSNDTERMKIHLHMLTFL